MSLNLTNLFYSEKDIGATLKISKRQFIWEFELNGSSQRLELLDSRFSRKKRLYKNGLNILDTTETGNFIHNFEIDGHACVIIQYGDKIELRIDNQSFTHLYNLQKNKELFAGEKGPTSNTYVAKPFSSSSTNEKKSNEEAFYKINKPEEENKPKLFNFEIKKNTGNKNTGGFNKFKFGENKEQNNNNNINNNNNANANTNNNKGNVDLLGFNNNNQNANNNINNNNNNLLDFGNANNQNNMNNKNQNLLGDGNDLLNLMGNNNNSNQPNNNNQFNNIFLQITDGTNQQPTFDQNNLGFLNFNNNGNNNNMQQPQQQNQNNNGQNNSQNNGNNIDFLKFD